MNINFLKFCFRIDVELFINGKKDNKDIFNNKLTKILLNYKILIGKKRMLF